MAISSFDRPAGLPPVDFDFLFKTKVYGDEQNKKADEEYLALSENIGKIKALPQDQPIRNKLVLGYNDQLKSWVDKYGENPRAGIAELRKLKRDFTQNFQYGQLGAIQSSYENRVQHEKEIDKAFSEGKINQQRRDALLNYDMLSYSGIGEGGTQGIYNTYKGSTPAKEVDIAKLVDERLSGWKADKKTTGGYKSYGYDNKGLYFINNKDVKEYADPIEMESVIRPVLEQNPEVRSFIDQETKFSTVGINPGATYQVADASGKPVNVTGQDLINYQKQSYINNAVNYGIAKHGYFQHEQEQTGLTFAPEFWTDPTKQPQGTTGLYAPSTASPYNNYWEREKNAITPPSKVSSAISGAIATPSGLPWLTGLAVGWAAGGTSKERTIKQEGDLKKAEKVFGIYSSDPKKQGDILNKYYSYMGSQMQNIPWQFPATSTGDIDYEASNKKALALNNFYFGNPEKPTGSSINTNVSWKEVGGNNEVLSPEQLKKKVGKVDVFFKWMGSLPDDNFYFPAGEGFEAVDADGNVLGRFVTEAANSNLYKTGWEFYQIKMGEDIKLSQFPDYTVSYERGFDKTTLDNEGYPIRDFSNDVVVVKDKQGNVIMRSSKGSNDPVADVYNQFKTAVNSGIIK